MKFHASALLINFRLCLVAVGLLFLSLPHFSVRDPNRQASVEFETIGHKNRFTTPVVLIQDEPEVLDLSFDDVKFEMEKNERFKASMLTDKIRAMEGKQIKIRGYMQPSFKQKGIKSFVFVRDNQECCFGPGAALYDCMIVKLKKGKSTSFQIRPFAVEGTFSIKEYEGPDGKPWAIFRLSDAVVK